MSFESDLVAILEATPALTALVDNRIYPKRLPQEPTLPAVTYFTVSTTRESSHGGYARLAMTRLQISAWSTIYADVIAVIRQVRLALQNKTALGVGLHVSERDFYEPEIDYWQRVFEIMITRQEVE